MRPTSTLRKFSTESTDQFHDVEYEPAEYYSEFCLVRESGVAAQGPRLPIDI